jgi:hypothetical protein
MRESKPEEEGTREKCSSEWVKSSCSPLNLPSFFSLIMPCSIFCLVVYIMTRVSNELVIFTHLHISFIFVYEIILQIIFEINVRKRQI